MKTPRRSILLTLLAAGCAWALPAGAQTAWPNKTVRLIVPFSPGGSTDTIARLVAQKLSENSGQTVVVENKPGAGGNLGADTVAKASPDGSTLLFASGSITINPHIYRQMSFDTKKDLVPVTNVASGPMLVVVPDDSPARSIQDLIKMAKANPGKLNFGSAGVGSQVHLAGENFADAAGIDITHVPYKGEAPAYVDLIARQTQMMVGNFAAASALLGKDRLRAIAVTSRQRVPSMPDLPTAAESGLPGFENTGWFGLLAPAGTPRTLVDKMQQAVVKALGSDLVKTRLQEQGLAPIGNTPEAFAKAMDDESSHWARVVKNRRLAAN